MSQKRSEFDKIRPLLELASEEVISWTDEEVRARAAEEEVDLKRNAAEFRATIAEHMENSRLSRLKRARASLDAEQARSPQEVTSREISMDQLLIRLKEIIASGLMAKDSRLSLAARDGGDISAADLRSLLDDYEELKMEQQGHDKAGS